MPINLAASSRSQAYHTNEGLDVGFRVASIPEPGTGLLLSLGMLGVAGWRRRSA